MLSRGHRDRLLRNILEMPRDAFEAFMVALTISDEKTLAMMEDGE